MADWRLCKKLGIVICKQHTAAGRLNVDVGSALFITEETSDWFRGCLNTDRSVRGIIPRIYVHIKESSLVKLGHYDTVTPKEAPIIQEITTVVREWGTILKTIYVKGKMDDYREVRSLMMQLIGIRRELMSKKLTLDDFRQKQLQAASKIDHGNMLLGLDLVIRDEQGDVINPETIGAIKLFQDHITSVEMNQKRCHEFDTRASQRHTLNLFVRVINVVCRVGDEADVIMSLYDVTRGEFFSENYVMRWGQKGLPKDLDMMNNLRVLFTDLGSKDLKTSREQVFLVCQIVRLGGMFPPPENELKQSRVKNVLRRPFGVAALDVTGILNGTVSPDEDKQHSIPVLPCGKNDFLETMIREAVKAEEVTQRTHKGQCIWMSVKLLDGDLKQVRDDYPHLINGQTTIARKMGFPEVIMPSDVRNDFYVTIIQGDFSRDTGKFADRSIEIIMQVCSRDGKPLQQVVDVGGGAVLQNEYKSVVYRHQDSPRWFETFRIAVPIEEFYNCHLKFLFRHRSGNEAKDKGDKDFAIAHVSFIHADQTTLVDGVHNLLVYSIDSKKSSDTLAYLSLPSLPHELDKEKDKSGKGIAKGPYSLSRKDSFQLCTLACSTKLTHNRDLLGLLDWRTHTDAVPVHLKQLMNVDGEEVVKFLQDTLDALFSILLDPNLQSDINDAMVFDALIFVIGLISDRKYSQFRQVLEAYIQDTFSATLAYNKLIVVLKRYIDNACDGGKQDRLYKTLKSLGYLMKIIIRSRMLYAKFEDKGKQQFEISMKQLFQSINGMMCYSLPNTLKTQGAALKYLPVIISDVLAVLDRCDFARLLVQFIGNVPKDRLVNQKLVCILDIVNSPLFKYCDSRYILLDMVVDHVQKEISEQTKDLDICARIVSNVLHQINDSGKKEDIALLFDKRDLLRTIIQHVIKMDRSNKLVQDYVAVMMATLHQMTEEHYTLYLSNFQTSGDLFDFLMEIIIVFRDLIERCVFPENWNDMIMMQNRVLLKSLRCFSHTIREKFSSPFDSDRYCLWNNFFHTGISFLTQDALQLEKFSSAKRRKIIARYGDMRREMAIDIKSMWLNLGQHKIRFIPDLIGPILEMTLIPERELRRDTLLIFFDMMQCEFTQLLPGINGPTMNGNFRQFENELITKMDAQVEGGNGDEQYVELFYVVIHERCANHQIMREQGLRFVEVIKDLLTHLLEYRTIIHDENKENRMNCIVNLLNFYRKIDRQEMYIRYLHKLCDLHLECQNYTEAAYTLLLYTKLLRWSDEPLESLLKSDMFKNAQSHRELKDQLYHEIIKYFDEGKMWEKGIEMCKELVEQYEDEIFDYEHLCSMLRKQADFYDKILKHTRHPPGYYRVSYYGNGFPSFLSNKTFVYRGKEFEMISDFSARIQNQFPNAELLKSLDSPSVELMESSGQYLQINSVNPIFEPRKHLVGKPVSEQILRYWRSNELQRFTYARPLEMTNDLTKMWLERTNLTISTSLPGILRWFPVIDVEKCKVSPLENAIDTIETTNGKLQVLLEDHQRDPSLKIDPLSMLLNGVVDPAVNGGISQYKTFFTRADSDGATDQYSAKTVELEHRLKAAATDQILLLTEGLNMHAEKCPDSLKPFHDRMIEQFRKMLDLMQQEYGITPPLGAKHIKRRPSMAQTAASRMNTQQHSDSVSTPEPVKKLSIGSRTSSLLSKPQSFLRESKNATKAGARNSGRVPSSYSTDSKDSGDSNEKKSDTVIELRQELTSARPPRPDTRSRSRPSSGNFKQKLQPQLSLPSILNGTSSSSTAGNGKPSVVDGYPMTLAPHGSVNIESPSHYLITGQSDSSGLPHSSSVSATVSSLSFAVNGQTSNPSAMPGYSTKWESTGSLSTADTSAVGPSNSSLANNGFKSAGGSTPSLHNQAYGSSTSVDSPPGILPPPLPVKHSQADYGNMDMANHSPRVTMRIHSHKGRPPPALPKSRIANIQADEVPPPIPVKRSSLGNKSEPM